MYPKSIEKLIESFKMLPGVGNKSAARYAREYDFVVTTMQGFNSNIKLPGIGLDDPVSYKITFSNDMNDESKILYYYMED